MSRREEGLDLRGCYGRDRRLRCPVCGREGVGRLFAVAGRAEPCCARCAAGLPQRSEPRPARGRAPGTRPPEPPGSQPRLLP